MIDSSEPDVTELLRSALEVEPRPEFVAVLGARLGRERPRRRNDARRLGWTIAAGLLVGLALPAVLPRPPSPPGRRPIFELERATGVAASYVPEGLLPRLERADWLLVARVDEVRDGWPRSIAFSLEDAHWVGRGEAEAPPDWTEAMGKGGARLPDLREFDGLRAGDWMVFLLTREVQPSWADNSTARIAGPDVAVELLLRIVRFREADPDLGAVLAGELLAGGADFLEPASSGDPAGLPWSEPEDLIADLGAVGGPAEANELRRWAAEVQAVHDRALGPGAFSRNSFLAQRAVRAASRIESRR